MEHIRVCADIVHLQTTFFGKYLRVIKLSQKTGVKYFDACISLENVLEFLNALREGRLVFTQIA